MKTKLLIGVGLSILFSLIVSVNMGYMFLLGWLFVDIIRKEPE